MDKHLFLEATGLEPLLERITTRATGLEEVRKGALTRANQLGLRISIFKSAKFQAEALNDSVYSAGDAAREAGEVHDLARGFKNQDPGHAFV